MTREEAMKLCSLLNYPESLISLFEALGLLKFEETTQVPMTPFVSDTFKYATNAGDRTFLNWIYERMKNVYNENPNIDYMHTLKRFVDDWVAPAKLQKLPVAFVVDGGSFFTDEREAQKHADRVYGHVVGLYRREETNT